MQFVGHGVFEKRAPALVSNFFFGTIAPFFVIFEVMVFFGYKRELMERIQKMVDEDI